MENLCAGRYVLGLDVGANSVGWSVMPVADDEAAGLLSIGVRAFDAGVEGEIESGQDASRAVKRREARMHRRMLDRRARRLDKLATLLQTNGLLPKADLTDKGVRQRLCEARDLVVYSCYGGGTEKVGASLGHTVPYFLRARALDAKLEAYDLGRALYHLAHRRGFISNRKTAPRDAAKEKDEGKVKEGIKDLLARIQASGARTLGEYFSKLDPEDERIRARWTSRQMYWDEFEAIWAAQTPHHPSILTDDLKKTLRRAIFFQRPLKWDRDTIGDCELEKGRKRAALALLIVQRFRLLQKVNDLKLKGVDTETGEIEDERPLTPEERAKLIPELEAKGDRTFPQIRKLLGLPKWIEFNFEASEERLIGNRTAAKLIKIFGDRWSKFSSEDKDRIVQDILSFQKDNALARRGRKAWGLDEPSAQEFGKVPLEQGHCNLSRRAIEKLLPLMEQGTRYATARKEIYGEQGAPQSAELLPPLTDDRVPDIRNPAVSRALTEVRKVVNAVIRAYGKPAMIRVELARDLKKPRKDRQRISKQYQQNRKARDKAVERLLAEAGIAKPSGADIEKWLLADECEWQCPYTGKTINPASLFGPAPQFDVEHIIPLSRCMDNSFMNKTLCHVEENRNVKRNRSPWEAYGANPEKWDQILQRVRKFRGDAARAKLERFQITNLESIEDYSSRQLNDTRYASRLAVRYLGLLYGTDQAGVAPNGTRPVQAGRGQVTKYIRDEFHLNEILGDGGEKSRDDHRHHAVDAVCIALTSPKTVKMLSSAAAHAIPGRRFDRDEIKPPWSGFLDDVRRAVENMVVSHRVSRKVNGPLHDETVYSKLYKDESGRECVRVRKLLGEKFSEKMIAQIVDPAVRERVRIHFEQNGKDSKAAFADATKHPYLEAKNGKKIPIHSVRVHIHETTMPIGQGHRQRRVMSGSNHHVEIIEVIGKGGKPKWEGYIVSRFEAMQRLRNRQPIIQREHGEGKRFVFSLAGGETFQLDEPDGTRGLYVVRTITKMKQRGNEYINIAFVHINDARKKADIINAGEWRTGMLEPLRKLNCQKVTVTPIGEVRRAND
ncbi:MAG: type II CRISPR RNA-guided endonuclease Cas9 [Planctomycetota bacterium]